MLDWLVVGAGIHGSYLALLLRRRLGIPAAGIRLLDPLPPLAHWRFVTGRTGMRYLRSPGVHHLDLAPRSLLRFLPSPSGAERPGFLPPYGRPRLELFNRHAAAVLERHRLGQLWIQGSARALEEGAGGYQVRWDGGCLAARNVVLALGQPPPYWPRWALRLRHGGGRVVHVFDPAAPRPEALAAEGPVAVIGAGLTGVQLAVHLAARGAGGIVLISRRRVQVQYFDTEPGWVGRRLLEPFASHRGPEERRRMIRAARRRGSITPEALLGLEQAVAARRVLYRQTRVESASCSRDGGVRLMTADGPVEVRAVILTTGFASRRPGGSLVDRAIGRLELPCGPRGFPIVDRSLRWREGLYVSGALAELELGPTSRNISGAQRAAARLAHFLRPGAPAP